MQQAREYGWFSEGLDRRDLKSSEGVAGAARDMSEVRKWLVALASANLPISWLLTRIGKRIDLNQRIACGVGSGIF